MKKWLLSSQDFPHQKILMYQISQLLLSFLLSFKILRVEDVTVAERGKEIWPNIKLIQNYEKLTQGHRPKNKS